MSSPALLFTVPSDEQLTSAGGMADVATKRRRFERLPGAVGVELRLRVERRHDLAAKLVAALRLAVADLALQRAGGGRRSAR